MRDLSTELKGNTGQSMQDEDKKTESRYIIGIDLGTTNSAVSFVDLTRKPYRVEDFPNTDYRARRNCRASSFPHSIMRRLKEFSSGSLAALDTQDRKVITGALHVTMVLWYQGGL